MIEKIKAFLFNKKFLRTLLIVAITYTIVVGGTMIYLNSYTRHGEQIKVPNLSGKNVKSIQPLMAELNLDFEVLDSIYNPEVAAGTIVDQDPKPTETSEVYVKEGRVIRLRVSKRTRVVEMPSLVDKSQRFAESVLKNRGLKYKITFKNTTEANGAVLEQRVGGKEVAEGEKLAVGTTVHLVIGRNEGGMPMPIPDLYGLTISEAKNRLIELNGVMLFPVCNECKTAEDSSAARINSQSPPYYEGALIPPGSTITINAVLNFSDTTQTQLP